MIKTQLWYYLSEPDVWSMYQWRGGTRLESCWLHSTLNLTKVNGFICCYYASTSTGGGKKSSLNKEFIKHPAYIPQLINIRQGRWKVCVMDGCRWWLWQLINALIISGEDLPLLPELTEWAVCGLTGNPVFRARPPLSAVLGSHSFSLPGKKNNNKKKQLHFLCWKGVQQWWNRAPGCSGIFAT